MRTPILLLCLLPTTVLAVPPNPDMGPGLRRILYVAQDDTGKIILHDIDRNHRPVREIATPVKTFRGLCADAGAARLFFSDDASDTVYAWDLISEQILWKTNITRFGGKFPDRLAVTSDGHALYVPCKQSEKYLVLDAATGDKIAEFPRPGQPHNTFTGPAGRYMYCAGRSDPTLYVLDPATHKLITQVGPFSSPIRPFSVDDSETFVFCNLTKTLGFAMGEIATGKVVCEIEATPPKERTAHPEAFTDLPHGDKPLSHGIAVRPGSKEVWVLDDGWGYAYVYDFTTLPPRRVANVPLFSDIKQKAGPAHNRWLSFSIDGKYCYTPTRIINADALKVTGQLEDSEKLIEVDFQDGVPVKASGQNGGVYPAKF